MKKVLTTALAAAALIGGVASSTEASAQYRRDYHHRDHDAGAALALGVLAGAGLARPYGYYSYYGPRPYGYYAPYRYRHCWVESRRDPWYGRVRERVCR